MPKNPLKFARRKSSGNVLDEIQAESPTAPAVSSFRVLERPEKINLNASQGAQDRLRKVNRPFQSPLQQLRGRSAEELSGTGVNRGSGGTTNSGSSGYNESSGNSARHSSTSTLPSSVDVEREREEEELFPRKTKTLPMYHSPISRADDLPPPRQSLTSRAARALSFGPKHGSTTNGGDYTLPPLPAKNYSPPQRERATTTSSYASTAKPTKPELNLSLGTSDFGGDFTNMFDSPQNDLPPPPPPKTGFHRTVRDLVAYGGPHTYKKQESEPMFPPKTFSRPTIKESPSELQYLRDGAESPYAFDRRGSNDGLMSSSAKNSPRINEDYFAPPVPAHSPGIAPAFLGKSKTGYSLVPDRYSPGLERLSQESQSGFQLNGVDKRDAAFGSKTSLNGYENGSVRRVELHDAQEPDYASSESSISESSRSATITRKPISGTSNGPPATRKPLGMPSQAIAGASRDGALSPESVDEDMPLWSPESINTTPRAAKLELPNFESDSLFDSSPLGPASRAVKPQHMRTDSGTPKKMTKAQFERLQRRGDASTEQSDEGENSAEEYDDLDDAERAKIMARRRQKQEANMSLYRQQMKKVTGGGPTDLPSSMPRPTLDRAAASAPAGGILHLGGIGGKLPEDSPRGRQKDDDDDEDVPLGILQAHGFPGANRPPTRTDNDRERRVSTAGSVVGGGAGQGNLPPFARRLPADPYFGSSLVNQSHRESLGMSSAASVYGGPSGASPMMGRGSPQMPPTMGHPGGLVGVIAGEERAKAARRGSPNPVTGAFTNPGVQPPMGGMLGMGRTMTMPAMASPQVYTPSGIGAGPMMPGMPTMPQMMQAHMMQQQPPQMQNPQNDQMQKFMEMQMQLMQNMLSMQQQQMGQTPPPQPPQQQAPDYLSIPVAGHQHRMSMASQGSHFAPSIKSQTPPLANQGRAMTMMHPPTRWDVPPGAQRPNSAMPAYGPSGLQIPNGGPGPGYTPSIAPSERSNVGMPSRYRPVTTGNDGSGRSQTMTSASMLQASGFSQAPPPPPKHDLSQRSTSTVRVINRKAVPKVTAKPVTDEDDEEGWAEMRKKREAKKKFGFGRRDKHGSTIGDLYHNFD